MKSLKGRITTVNAKTNMEETYIREKDARGLGKPSGAPERCMDSGMDGRDYSTVLQSCRDGRE
jgi:hypothetical protein